MSLYKLQIQLQVRFNCHRPHQKIEMSYGSLLENSKLEVHKGGYRLLTFKAEARLNIT
jgi:hypothetical protein